MENNQKDQKQLVEEIESLRQRIAGLEKTLAAAIAVKSQFISLVSHELRTPLTAIKEGIGIVLDGTAGPLKAEQKKFLEIAKRNVDRLNKLINDILDFQKIHSSR